MFCQKDLNIAPEKIRDKKERDEISPRTWSKSTAIHWALASLKGIFHIPHKSCIYREPVQIVHLQNVFKCKTYFIFLRHYFMQ
jgi:hypothetical protein